MKHINKDLEDKANNFRLTIKQSNFEGENYSIGAYYSRKYESKVGKILKG